MIATEVRDGGVDTDREQAIRILLAIPRLIHGVVGVVAFYAMIALCLLATLTLTYAFFAILL